MEQVSGGSEEQLSWIWNERFWFPPGGLTGWKDLENKPGSDIYLPQIMDLHWSILLGVALLGIRNILEILFVVPLGRKMGVKDLKKPFVQPNAVLEAAFKTKTKRDHKIIEGLAKQTDLTERQVEIWFRRRQTKDMPTPMQKFRECSWHFFFYLTFFIYGLVILWNKPWFWSTKYCWIGWPSMHVSRDIYWYYMIELSFYWSLIFTLFSDHKRKDFKEMVIHHVATITLMYFSWLMNFVRVGTLVLLVHDASDYWMAAAKMCRYSRRPKLTDFFFAIFLLVWIVSRLVIYPFVCLYTTMIEPYYYVMDHTFGSHWFFNFFLIVLQILHIVWSYYIGRIVYNKLIVGELNDVRSDSSDMSSFSDMEDTVEKNGVNHNSTNNIKSAPKQKSG